MSKEALIIPEIIVEKPSPNGHVSSISEDVTVTNHEISFEPQFYEIIVRDGIPYIKFFGEESSGMKLFYAREESYRRKMKEQKEIWEQKNVIEVNLDGAVTILEPNEALELTPRRAIPSQ